MNLQVKSKQLLNIIDNFVNMFWNIVNLLKQNAERVALGQNISKWYSVAICDLSESVIVLCCCSPFLQLISFFWWFALLGVGVAGPSLRTNPHYRQYEWSRVIISYMAPSNTDYDHWVWLGQSTIGSCHTNQNSASNFVTLLPSGRYSGNTALKTLQLKTFIFHFLKTVKEIL